MNNEAKERLRTVTRNLADITFVHAHGLDSSEEEFQTALEALVEHLVKVRKRAQEILQVKEMAQ